MQIVRVVFITAALALSCAAPAFAQTTGQIFGLVADAAGKGVPAVVVTATSPQLVGTLSVQTDTSGRFAFFALSPGTYSVQAALTGFQSATHSGIIVTLNQMTTVSMKLIAGEPGAGAGTSGQGSGAVDVRAPSRVLLLSAEGLTQLPVSRDFSAVLNLASFAPVDEMTVEGLRTSSEARKVGSLEGTSPVLDFPASRLPSFPASVDFVDFATASDGRVNPEYRSTSSVDVLLRSGSNGTRGDLFVFGTGKGLTAKNSTRIRVPLSSTEIEDVTRDVDAGGVVGGYLVKNKAWFFGGYDEGRSRRVATVIRATPGSPAIDTKVPLDSTQHLAAGKLTLNFGGNQRLTGSVTANPSTLNGPLFPIAGPSTTWLGTLEEGGIDAVARYDAAMGRRWTLEGLYGRHNDNATYGGAGTATPEVLDQTQSPVAASGGFGFFQNRDLKRDQFAVRLSAPAHTHAFKVGLEYDRLDALVTSFSGGGGQRIDKRLLSSGLLFYQHRYYNPTVNQVAPSFRSHPISAETTIYAQDNWNVAPKLTLLGGVRWSRQTVSASGGSSALDITGNWAGRFGAVFAPGSGRSKIVGYAGRFFDALPLELAMRAAGGESWCVCANFSPADVTPPVILIALPSANFGRTSSVDPDLRGQFSNEYGVGYERELVPLVLISGRYSYRTLGRIVEDIRGASGEFLIVNPSQGSLGKTLRFFDGTTMTTPEPKRVSHRIEGSVRHTFGTGWQMFAHYAWSKVEGNYDGPALTTIGRAEMNLTPAYDYADFLINADGRLPSDRTHVARLDASYTLNTENGLNGLTVGGTVLAMSGMPQSAYSYSATYQAWVYSLIPREMLERNPAYHEVDLHAAYPVRLGKRASLQLTADFFNLRNRQSPIVLDQRYNLSSNPACAGLAPATCNGDGGLLHNGASLTPIELPTGLAASFNPDFQFTGVKFTGPFSARIGLRIRF